MEYIAFAMVLGLIPAMIAKSKGHSFGLWWLYGAALLIIALPHALIMKPDRVRVEERAIEEGDVRKCPFCAELVKVEAKLCRYCQHELPAAERREHPLAWG